MQHGVAELHPLHARGGSAFGPREELVADRVQERFDLRVEKSIRVPAGNILLRSRESRGFLRELTPFHIGYDLVDGRLGAEAFVVAEFGRKFGKTAFARYLGQLKSAAFVREDRLGNLSEGPLLDLLIDGVEMAQKLRDSVLWDLLERGPGSGDDLEPADSDTGDSDDDAEDED